MKLVLLVEDDPLRAEKIQACIPKGARCIWARSAGAAIGVLKRDMFVCVLLDHDLESNPQTSGLDGRAAARTICETQSRKTCRIFIHSQNSIGGPAMQKLLSQAGFDVARCSWCEEASVILREWLETNLSEE
jgi:CheY-like chemotaxis protein